MADSDGGRVVVDDSGGVRLLTLDRPARRNAFGGVLYAALTDALRAAGGDEAVRVVVLTGSGPGFSSGQDLDEMAALRTGPVEGIPDTGVGFPALLEELQAFGKPLVVAVHGAAVGLGFTLLAHADLVVVAESARLRVPFAPMGVPPEAGSSVLFPALLGWQQAARVLLTGDEIGGEEAVRLGIALICCSDDEMLATATALAERIAQHPPIGVRAIKRLLLDGRRDAVAAAVVRETAAFADLFRADRAANGP